MFSRVSKISSYENLVFSHVLDLWQALGALTQRENLAFSRVFEASSYKNLVFSRVLGLPEAPGALPQR